MNIKYKSYKLVQGTKNKEKLEGNFVFMHLKNS